LLICISLIKILVVKIHKMYKIYKNDIINNLQSFDNTLIVLYVALGAVNTYISFIKLYLNE